MKLFCCACASTIPWKKKTSIFNCGFGFALIQHRKTLVFYRVQDHLADPWAWGPEGFASSEKNTPASSWDGAVMEKIEVGVNRRASQAPERNTPASSLNAAVMQKIREVFTDKGVEQMRAIWGASASPKRRAQGM